MVHKRRHRFFPQLLFQPVNSDLWCERLRTNTARNEHKYTFIVQAADTHTRLSKCPPVVAASSQETQASRDFIISSSAGRDVSARGGTWGARVSRSCGNKHTVTSQFTATRRGTMRQRDAGNGLSVATRGREGEK